MAPQILGVGCGSDDRRVLWGGGIKNDISTMIDTFKWYHYNMVLRERDGTVGMSTVSLYHKNKILDAAIL